MKTKLITLFFFFPTIVFSQIVLTLDGLNTNYYNVPRERQTKLTVMRSLFTSGKENGFVLESGDDAYIPSHLNKLDGAKIIGNKFVWTAYNSYPGSILHAVMNGFNINYVTKHNFSDAMPYSFIYKGGREVKMEWTAGGHSYNVHKNCKALIVKGMSGVMIYNNTFYVSGYGAMYHIYVHDSGEIGTSDHNQAERCKIKNNIFYQKQDIPAIKIDEGARNGFECDYNLYYCEDCVGHKPHFNIEGRSLTWDQWRALGYDEHSVIVNPDFINTITLVPVARLDYGVDLGPGYSYGLAINAVWTVGQYPDTTQQDGPWQVGAHVYGSGQTGSGEIIPDQGDNKEELIVYPNPNKGRFTVELTSPVQNISNELIVANQAGRVVHSDLILQGEIIRQIDLSHLKTGLYIIFRRESHYSAKFIKE